MSIAPPTGRRAIDRLLSPVVRFARLEAAGGILLLICTAVAVVWANSPWRASYFDFWHLPVTIQVGTFTLSESLAHWVNDGLMAIFFFVVGLEIKRELLVGELASPRKAAIPVAAAVGGMAVPALVYALVNTGGDGMKGWAIPAATDIAFALGIMALLGKRVPLSLKVFLMALAIVDDIGAVLVIALFYTSDISWTALGAAGVMLVLLATANRLHVRNAIVYLVLGLLLWVAFLLSGVHATLAGVLLAFTIPARFRIRGADFVAFARRALNEFEQAGGNENDLMTNQARQKWLHGMELASEHVDTPLLRLEHALVPWVAFAIMPIFALANAGVEISGGFAPALGSRISLGIILGLVLGKQAGIMLCTWLAVRLGLGSLPEGVTWKHIYATSWLAGIGFTMSLFIAYLGFGAGDQLVLSKYGILAGSLIAGVGGYILLRLATRPQPGSV
ncbi:MAG: Na+/H+ antiporter NhaA [Planctomycetota bacterium]|jgi:NhaA family Na+:H+ antiporter